MMTRTAVAALLLLKFGCSGSSGEADMRSPTTTGDGGGAAGNGGPGGGDSSGSGTTAGTNGSAGEGGPSSGGDGGSSSGPNNGSVDGGSTGGGELCDCAPDERCTPEGRCEAACACDDIQGACDDGCSCDYACGPASCAPFVTALEYLTVVARGGLALWDRDTGLLFGDGAVVEFRDGVWGHLRAWDGFGADDVVMDTADSAWLAGDGIARWKNGSLTVQPGFDGKIFKTVRLSPDGHGIAVGNGASAALLNPNTGAWAPTDPGAGLGLFLSADVVDDGDAWITTTTHLLRRKAGAWQALTTSLPRLTGVSLVDGDNGWGRSTDNKIYELRNGEWSAVPAAALDGQVLELDVDAAGRGFAVTEGLSFYRLDSGKWAKMSKERCQQSEASCTGRPLGLAFVEGLAVVYVDGGFWVLRGQANSWSFQQVAGQISADLSAIAFAGATAHVASSAGSWLRRSEGIWSFAGFSGVGLGVSTGAPVPWAAGEDGLLAYYDGADGRWFGASGFDPNDNTQSPLTDANLYGIAMNPDESGWAVGGDVGAKGVVLRRTTAGKWIKHGFASSDELHAIALESKDTGWAVGGSSLGGSSVIARLDAGAWTEIVSPTTLPLWGVALDRNGDGWAVGGTVSPMASVVLRLKDGKWSVVEDIKPVSTLRAVAIDAAGYGWAVGTGAPGAGAVGVALHGDTAAVCPDAFDRFASRDAYGVAIDSEGRSWVVGADGFRAHAP